MTIKDDMAILANAVEIGDDKAAREAALRIAQSVFEDLRAIRAALEKISDSVNRIQVRG